VIYELPHKRRTYPVRIARDVSREWSRAYKFEGNIELILLIYDLRHQVLAIRSSFCTPRKIKRDRNGEQARMR